MAREERVSVIVESDAVAPRVLTGRELFEAGDAARDRFGLVPEAVEARRERTGPAERDGSLAEITS